MSDEWCHEAIFHWKLDNLIMSMNTWDSRGYILNHNEFSWVKEISSRTHWPDTWTWVSNSSSNLLRGPLVRSHSVFDEMVPLWVQGSTLVAAEAYGHLRQLASTLSVVARWTFLCLDWSYAFLVNKLGDEVGIKFRDFFLKTQYSL